jgi:hypothetical protein
MNAKTLSVDYIRDARGCLHVLDIPFPVVRAFEIRDVNPVAIRGNHAHRNCDQIIRCITGECMMTTQSSAKSIRSWILRPGTAVLVPRMHWIMLCEFTVDCIVSVLCSEKYVPPITDFEEFLKG